MMAIGTPPALITVVLPTFNSARFLAEAIESILGNTVREFTLAILDGGSSDPTTDIARGYAKIDRRVALHSFPGIHPCERIDDFLTGCRSKYVAIQHSDDVSYPRRLERQIAAFAADPDLGVNSTAYRSFWSDHQYPASLGSSHFHAKPQYHDDIKANLLFWWVMHCPTLMLSVDKMRNVEYKFTNEFKFSNDYWNSVRFIEKLKFSNVQEELSSYRLHYSSDGSRNMECLRRENMELKRRISAHFGFNFPLYSEEIHARFRMLPDDDPGATTIEHFGEIDAWLEDLGRQNRDLRVFNVHLFDSLVANLRNRVRRKKALFVIERGLGKKGRVLVSRVAGALRALR